MTIQLLDIFQQFMNSSQRCLALLCLLFLCQTSFASDPINSETTQNDTKQVGKASLVLGKVYLERRNHPRERIKVDSPIRVGDSILTESNGHAHIRFIDNGLVSVRPGSRLSVVRYDYNPARPEQSLVKFNLQEGVTRSISGDAARSARQRFRLNTPIAAIGVRGTDFVVSATASTTRALVKEGTIVLAPYTNECSAASFGPCNLNAVELTDSSLQIIEFDGTTHTPRLLPAPHERDPGGLRDEVQLAIVDDTEDDNSNNKEAQNKTVTNEVSLEDAVPAQVIEDEVIDFPPATMTPDFTPAVSLSAEELGSRQLVWGRWADAQLDLERITLPYSVIRDEAGEERSVAVGNSDYILFRNEANGTRVDRGLGVVSFNLHSAQAFYSSTSGVVAMQVDGGNLDIDFNRSEFATALNLSHGLTGNVDFIANGSISAGGYFNSRNELQRIAGAVSIDGQEAGYFFERQLSNGDIHGLTLWDAQ